MGERSKQIGKRIGCAGVISAAAVTIGLSVQHGLELWNDVLTPKSIANQTAMLRQEECIYHAIRAEVPRGAPVYITGPNGWLLTELTTLWGVPQARLADAQWRLSLVQVPDQGHCRGIAVKVSRT